MPDEVYADSVERLFHLQCVKVCCRKNVRLVYATYLHDWLGNTVPAELSGPYLTSHYDYDKFMRGSRHWYYEYRGRLRVRRYPLMYRDNDYSDGRPDFPKFGFTPDRVVWMCEGDERALWLLAKQTKHPIRAYHELLIDIVHEAAEYEKRRWREELKRFD